MTDQLRELAHRLQGGSWWVGVLIWLGMFAASIGLVTFVVIRWPKDHFKPSDGGGFWRHRHPVIRALGLAAKNLIGLVLLVLGLLMSLPGIPGQGILTMLIGLTLVDFPGKRSLERKIVARPSVCKGINALRARFGRPALELD
jgi:hypothetical protein